MTIIMMAGCQCWDEHVDGIALVSGASSFGSDKDHNMDGLNPAWSNVERFSSSSRIFGNDILGSATSPAIS